MIWLAVGAVIGAVVGAVVSGALARRRPTPAPPGSVVAAAPDRSVPPLDVVVEDHPTGIVVADAAGRETYRNVAARALVGTHAGVLIDAAVERHLDRARRGASGHEVVELYGPPRMVVEIVAHPLPDGRAVAFVDDISERRRLDQVRTDFVANVSHELKTPVGALVVLAETLADERDPVVVQRLVARMHDEAARAAHTIDNLIELSRIEAGGDHHHDPVELADVVRAAVARVAELAARREISLSTLVETSGALVRGDRVELVSAVGNLVENAVKYTEPGGHVTVRLGRQGDRFEIAVTDDGVGIPQHDLERIFERFYRVDPARSRTTGGTGLGLSIVRHVAIGHGGEVTVTSAEGAGSTFTLRLPIGEATA